MTISAEVMQVNSSNTLLIGDNNRTYKVQIACINVEPAKEELAFNWLKKETVLLYLSKKRNTPHGFLFS